MYFNNECENFKLIKSIIKEQGFKNSRQIFIFLHVLKLLQMGILLLEKTDFKSKYILKAFTIFSYDEFSKTITCKIVCGKESYKGMGLKLLECVEEFASDHKVYKFIT